MMYFSHRQRSFKIGDIMSECFIIGKGAPEGSIMGPIMYNVFKNDILLMI